MDELERWLSEEGVVTGARQVRHIEYDSNWTDAFRVVLAEHRGRGWVEFAGGGPNRIGGLREALGNALAKAKVK